MGRRDSVIAVRFGRLQLRVEFGVFTGSSLVPWTPMPNTSTCTCRAKPTTRCRPNAGSWGRSSPPLSPGDRFVGRDYWFRGGSRRSANWSTMTVAAGRNSQGGDTAAVGAVCPWHAPRLGDSRSPTPLSGRTMTNRVGLCPRWWRVGSPVALLGHRQGEGRGFESRRPLHETPPRSGPTMAI